MSARDRSVVGCVSPHQLLVDRAVIRSCQWVSVQPVFEFVVATPCPRRAGPTAETPRPPAGGGERGPSGTRGRQPVEPHRRCACTGRRSARPRVVVDDLDAVPEGGQDRLVVAGEGEIAPGRRPPPLCSGPSVPLGRLVPHDRTRWRRGRCQRASRSWRAMGWLKIADTSSRTMISPGSRRAGRKADGVECPLL